ncbi:MAG: TetR/AcrR family transcriptional regulator [bacterium]|nr:TetR/AcrR family transcriptional regulator [bacterium]
MTDTTSAAEGPGVSGADATNGATDTYHHGHLREALLAAAMKLAAKGGPGAVQIRPVTRAVGVSPRAAYRHFENLEALVLATAVEGFRLMALEMDRGVRAICSEQDVAARARARAFAVGRAYLHFALRNPGIFQTSFFGPATVRISRSPAAEGGMGLTPYTHLRVALEEMRDTGQIPAERLDRDATIAWSLVHGFASLAIRGPLQELPMKQKVKMGEDLLVGLIDGMSEWPSENQIRVDWHSAAITPPTPDSPGW